MGKSHNIRQAKLRAKKKLEKLAKQAAEQINVLKWIEKHPTEEITYKEKLNEL